MIFEISYWTHSGIVFDNCHKNDRVTLKLFTLFCNSFFFQGSYLIKRKKYAFQHFTKRQNFGRQQIESICRQQNELAQMMNSVFHSLENIVRKRENADYQLLSPTTSSPLS